MRLEIRKLDIRIAQDIDSFQDLEKDWDRLVARDFAGHPFLSHFWYLNYYRAYFSGVPLNVLAAFDDSDQMAAALPMISGNRRMAGIPLKEAHLLAGVHSHLNRLLISDKCSEVAAMFLSRLLETGVDLIYLEDIPARFPDQAWVKDFCRQCKFPLEIRVIRRSPYIATTGSFEEYRKKLSKKFRELLNNRLNRINRAGGFEIKTFDGMAEFEVMISEMKTISADSWQGERGSGIFSGPENAQFYNNLIRHALENGYGRVFILYFEARPAAFEFHIFHDATEYCLKSEYARAFDKVSPGGVLDLELVKRAFASDTEVYDLLGFEDQYKLRWTERLTPYYRYYIFGRSAAAHTAHLLYYRIGNRLRQSRFLRRFRERRQTG